MALGFVKEYLERRSKAQYFPGTMIEKESTESDPIDYAPLIMRNSPPARDQSRLSVWKKGNTMAIGSVVEEGNIIRTYDEHAKN